MIPFFFSWPVLDFEFASVVYVELLKFQMCVVGCLHSAIHCNHFNLWFVSPLVLLSGSAGLGLASIFSFSDVILVQIFVSMRWCAADATLSSTLP